MDTPAIFACALMGLLAAISWIDFQRMIIPDMLNASLAVLGFTYQWSVSGSLPWPSLVVGAAAVSVFWLVRRVYFLATGNIGIGLGDVKMAGAAAIWIDPWNLPLLVFVASATALVFVVGLRLAGVNSNVSARQPFGPFLAAGLLTTWLVEQPTIFHQG